MPHPQVEDAIRFGHHSAKADTAVLTNYSHNGIGTKACLNFFSRLAIFSISRSKPATGRAESPSRAAGGRTYTLLLLDVADKFGDGKCQPALRLVWRGGGDNGKDESNGNGKGKGKGRSRAAVALCLARLSCGASPDAVRRACSQLLYLQPQV
jgi:hypothetical protein